MSHGHPESETGRVRANRQKLQPCGSGIPGTTIATGEEIECPGRIPSASRYLHRKCRSNHTWGSLQRGPWSTLPVRPRVTGPTVNGHGVASSFSCSHGLSGNWGREWEYGTEARGAGVVRRLTLAVATLQCLSDLIRSTAEGHRSRSEAGRLVRCPCLCFFDSEVFRTSGRVRMYSVVSMFIIRCVFWTAQYTDCCAG